MSGLGLRAQLIRGGAGSIAVQVAAFGVHLAVGIVLARSLGPDGYGTYAYVLALVTLMAVPAQLGLPTLVVRETARAHANEDWGLMRGLWRWTSVAAGVMALLIALVALGVGLAVASRFTASEFTTLGFGLLLIPLIALGNLRGAALRGLRRVVSGQLPEAVLRPGILLVLIAGAVLLWPPRPLTAPLAMGLHALAAASAFAAGQWMLWRARPAPLKEGPPPGYEKKAWMEAALPLALLAGIHTINSHADILLLGMFRSAEEVGVYRVVVQSGKLVLFGQGAVHLVVAPYFSRLHAAGDSPKLQRIATLSAMASLAMAAPVALAFVFFGGGILGLVFGAEYSQGSMALGIMAGGQIVGAALGASGLLLNMTGFERDTARSGAVATACNIVLNLVLIPPLGLAGAALSTALTFAGWTFMMWWIARQRLGIDTFAFTFRR